MKTSLLTTWTAFVLDVLFPVRCIRCSAHGAWLCHTCRVTVLPPLDALCPYCEKRLTPRGATCFACARPARIDGLLIAASYRNPLVAHAIHLLKYRFVADLAKPLGDLLKERIAQSGIALPDVLVPLPLHTRRLRWRGFNQAELLARHLAETLTPGMLVPVLTNAVSRTRATVPQMTITNHADRQRNLAGAFRVTNKKALEGKRVFLIDDVTTTGATLFACAETLKKAGAKEVWGVVIARQDMET